eukprot:9502534-Pyramimonas_sp.AAC.1
MRAVAQEHILSRFDLRGGNTYTVRAFSPRAQPRSGICTQRTHIHAPSRALAAMAVLSALSATALQPRSMAAAG